MKKFYLLTMSACMLSSFAIAEVSEKHVKRDLFGDSMGDTEDVSRFTEYYYDVEGINCKSIETGIGIKTKLESLFCDYVYVYDSNNLLLESYGIKNTETGMVKDKTFLEYTYDENYNLIEKREGGYQTYDSEWDGENMISYSLNILENENKRQVWKREFSDFLPGYVNLPQKVVSSGLQPANDYDGFYSYENGKLVKYETYNVYEKPVIIETYEYDEEGRCVLYLKEMYFDKEVDGVYDRIKEPQLKRVYSYNDKICKTETFTYTFEQWYNSATYTVDYYQTIDSSKAPVNLEVANISTVDLPNTLRITWEAQRQNGLDQQWDLYRDGLKIASFYSEDEFTYVDSMVVSGSHEYFVHYIEDSKPTYTITRPAWAEVSTSILPVTNVRLLSKDVRNEYDLQTGNTYASTFLTLTWDEPEGRFLPESYKVYIKYSSYIIIFLGETETTEIEVSIGTDTKAEIIIEAVYKTGSVRAESVTFTTTGVKFPATDKYTAYINDNMLNMPFLYQSAKVYTAAGALVASAYGESTVDVSSLSKGVYIIRIHTYEGEVVSKIVKN